MATLDTITLDNAAWLDEYSYEPVKQETARSVTGALVTWEQAQPAGEPMTLGGIWLTRSALQTLQAKRATAATAMTLTLDDTRAFSVLFDRSQKSIEVEAINGPYTVPAASDLYAVTLHLLILEQLP